MTFGEVTASYCLVSDPDESVLKDYMTASGNNTIPTAFIVGKSGLIEWIGRADAIDQPLAKVVADQWDRNIWIKARALMEDFSVTHRELKSLNQAKQYQAVLSWLEEAGEARTYFSPYVDDRLRTVELMALIGLKKVERAKAVFPRWKIQIDNTGPVGINGVTFLEFSKQMFSAASEGGHVEPALGEMAVFAANKAIAVLKEEGIQVRNNGGRSFRLEKADPVVLATAMQDVALMLASMGKAAEAVEVQKQAIERVPDDAKSTFEEALQEMIEPDATAAAG